MALYRSCLIGCMLLSGSHVHAAAVGTGTMTIDWNTLTLSGAGMTPSTVTLPDALGGDTFSSDAFVDIEYGLPAGQDDVDANNGASIDVSFISPTSNVTAASDGSTGLTTSSVSINNASSPDLYGQAFAFRNFVYLATGTGTVTASVDYSLSGNASVDSINDNVDGQFSYKAEALDVTTFLSEFDVLFASNGGNADDAADDAGSLAELAVEEMKLASINAFFGCAVGFNCVPSISDSGTISLDFSVVAGRQYVFGAEAEVGVWTSAVPVPAAVWLFASGLLGLIGIARRKSN